MSRGAILGGTSCPVTPAAALMNEGEVAAVLVLYKWLCTVS